MRFCLWVLAVVVTAGVCRASDPPNHEQLTKLYAESLKQLESAQNRKNELAQENEALKTKLAAATKQLDAARARVEALQEEAVALAERTFVLRAQAGAWSDFLKLYPRLQVHWEMYLSRGVLLPPAERRLIDATPTSQPAS